MYSQGIDHSYHRADDITALTDVDVAANAKRIRLLALDANWERATHSQGIDHSYQQADDITALTDVDVAANAKRICLRALDANWETCRILLGIGLYITNSRVNVWL